MSAKEPLKCPHCLDYFWRVNAFRKHLRRHPKQHSLPPPSPPTKLLSRRSSDVTDGVFDFATILEDDQDVTFDAQRNVDSDGDSYFSDRDINSNDTSASGAENDDISDIGDDDDEYDGDDDYGEEEDDDYDVNGDDDGGDDSDTDADNRNKKRDRNERHFDEYPPDYFIGRTVDDADIPYSDDIFPPPILFAPQHHLSLRSDFKISSVVTRGV